MAIDNIEAQATATFETDEGVTETVSSNTESVTVDQNPSAAFDTVNQTSASWEDTSGQTQTGLSNEVTVSVDPSMQIGAGASGGLDLGLNSPILSGTPSVVADPTLSFDTSDGIDIPVGAPKTDVMPTNSGGAEQGLDLGLNSPILSGTPSVVADPTLSFDTSGGIDIPVGAPKTDMMPTNSGGTEQGLDLGLNSPILSGTPSLVADSTLSFDTSGGIDIPVGAPISEVIPTATLSDQATADAIANGALPNDFAAGGGLTTQQQSNALAQGITGDQLGLTTAELAQLPAADLTLGATDIANIQNSADPTAAANAAADAALLSELAPGRASSTAEIEAAIANGAQAKDLKPTELSRYAGAGGNLTELGLSQSQIAGLPSNVAEPTNAELGVGGAAVKDLLVNANGEVDQLTNANVDPATRAVIAPFDSMKASVPDSDMLAGAGPVATRKNFPTAGGNQGFLNAQNRVVFGPALTERERVARDLRDQPITTQEAGALDNVRGYTRVPSTETPVYNPTNAAGQVDRDVYIVSLGRNYTMGIQRDNVDNATATKPNPEGKNSITADRAQAYEDVANIQRPGNIPKVVLSGGLFNNYGGFANSEVALVNKGEVLATGRVGPNQKVMISTANDGKGYTGDASTPINRGAQPVVNGVANGAYSQDFNELRSATAGRSAITMLDPSVADRQNAAELQRQVVYGTDESGQLHVLVSRRNMSQIDAVAQMRQVVGSRGTIGVSDGGDSAQLSVWNGRQYVDLVDSSRPVNAAVTFSNNRPR
jgi:hypothetical protein